MKKQLFIAAYLKIHIMGYHCEKIARLIIFTNKQRVYLEQYARNKFLFSFSVFFHAILMKSTIYFRVVAKDFNFPFSGGYLVRYGKIVSKVFAIFC